MSLLDQLNSNAPKQWVKQEVKRIKKDIQDNNLLLKQHSLLRQSVGLSPQDLQRESKIIQSNSSGKTEVKQTWSFKLGYSLDIPKKRGRPKKAEFELNQTRIVFYRNS